ncbi:MAG: protein kinase [Rickettsiales bacterium]|jgi:serine/threonine protein kinase|nr:protein kinase [Rickettsiales bacterium]
MSPKIGGKNVIKLGEGSYANIFLVYSTVRRENVVVKLFKERWGDLEETLRKNKEDLIYADNFRNGLFRSRGFLEILSTPEDEKRGIIISKYYRSGSLSRFDITAAKNFLTVECVLEFLQSLGTFHETGYIHCDLKPDNILVGDGGNLVMADFGLSRRFKYSDSSKFLKKKDILGTLCYKAPELYGEYDSGSNYEQIDIWSLGITLCRVLTGIDPIKSTYGNSNIASNLAATMINLPYFTEKWKGSLSKIMAGISEPLRNIIIDMLEINCSLRPTADDILNKYSNREKEKESVYSLPEGDFGKMEEKEKEKENGEKEEKIRELGHQVDRSGAPEKLAKEKLSTDRGEVMSNALEVERYDKANKMFSQVTGPGGVEAGPERKN